MKSVKDQWRECRDGMQQRRMVMIKEKDLSMQIYELKRDITKQSRICKKRETSERFSIQMAVLLRKLDREQARDIQVLPVHSLRTPGMVMVDSCSHLPVEGEYCNQSTLSHEMTNHSSTLKTFISILTAQTI